MSAVWTCPFCPLACDHVRVRAEGPTLALGGDDCALAARALAQFPSAPVAPAATCDGRPCTLADAVAAAAQVLAASRQPLFAGLGTDVAGARALYPLATATGAICDAHGGPSLMQGLRALQDRGQFTTTFAEVRTRADVIVFVGGVPADAAPLIGERLGIGDARQPARHVVVLAGHGDDDALLRTWAARPSTSVETVAGSGDLFDTLALLAALTAQRHIADPPPSLVALAQRLHGASYAVLVGAPGRLPAPAALAIEAVHRVVAELNRQTRAAALWIGGGNGAASANQVFAWLSGLPLRSRAGPRGLEHDPLAFDTTRLLARGAVDALLWVSSFDATLAPPAAAAALPRIVLGPPALAAACAAASARSVFIAVATPGIDCDGHLFRSDGTVLMPLHAARRNDALPSVADVAGAICKAMA
jgi:formylmethanofuran dehydrogenase subunit B